MIFGIIHQHVIFFMKCHFHGTGELCVNYIHNGLNWFSEYCFRCHSISLREWFLSSSSRQNGGTKSKYSIVEHDKRLALSSTQPRISKLAIRTIFVVKNVVVVCYTFLEQHFVVIIMVVMSYVPALKTW